MLLNDLFFIESKSFTETGFFADVRIDAGHALFEGHFPGAPVMPGVVQLQIIKEILEQQMQKKLKMKAMRTCKFLNIINPKETPLIRIEAKFVIRDLVDVVASVSSGDTVFLKAQLSYMS